MRTIYLCLIVFAILSFSFGCQASKKTDNQAPSKNGSAGGNGSEQVPFPPATQPVSSGPDSEPVNPVTQGVVLPADWPKDVPIMPGILHGGVITKPQYLSFSGIGDIQVKDVVDFYSKLSGWTKVGTFPSQSGQTIFSMAKGNKILQVKITLTEHRTSVNLIYGDKDKVPTLG